MQPADTPLDVIAKPVEDIGVLGNEWRELEGRSDTHSFFLSWHWIGNWLGTLPPHITPLELRITRQGQLVGLSIICKGFTPVLRFLQLSQLTLNATGDPALDCIAIEYNGFLAERGLGDKVARAGLDWLLGGGIPNQSLSLNGIDAHLTDMAISCARSGKRQTRMVGGDASPYVDLAAVRNSGEEYTAHLSRNSRQAIHRSLRYYESRGPLAYHAAATEAEALAIFYELQLAHQAYWQARGKPGAFANPLFKRFHTALIASAFSTGHIEMARISAGADPIGYLYNFAWHGTVYAYQSGFHYSSGKNARPGYVSHYLAILSSLARGDNIYDFMAGQGQYKSSLSTGLQNLAWLQLRSQLLSVKLDSWVRHLLTAGRHRFGREQ